MPNTQQEVMIYRNRAFSTAQSQFEKDLRKRQALGWKLLSITPTSQGFLTAIYEKDALAYHPNVPAISPYPAGFPAPTMPAYHNTNPGHPLPVPSDEKTLPGQNAPQPQEPALLAPSAPNPSDQLSLTVPASQGVPQPHDQLSLTVPVNQNTPQTPAFGPSSEPNPYNQASLTNPANQDDSQPYELPPPPLPSGYLYPANPYNQISLTVPPNPYETNPYNLIAPPPPPAAPPYSKAIFLSLIAAFLLSVSCIFSSSENVTYASTIVFRIGMSIFLGALVCLFIIDWKGFFTLDGLLKWRLWKTPGRLGMGCLFYCFFPIFFFIYLVRIGLRVFQTPGSIFSKRWDAPEPIKRRGKIGAIIGLIVIFPMLLCSLFTPVPPADANNASVSSTATTGQAPTTTASPSTPTQEPSPTATPSPTPVPYAHFGDGTFIVGKDIQPGTYRTREASPGCYFERLSGFGGSLNEIIANDDTDYPAIVTIARGDKGFQSNNCGTWTKDLSAITTSKTSFTDGTYIVGTDMKPGTYKSSGQSGCYYARLSGFGGTLDDILANDNTNHPAIVTISASDKGFQSKNCGTWAKV